jgi:hypothetical protein
VYIVIFLCFLGTDQAPSKNNAKETGRGRNSHSWPESKFTYSLIKGKWQDCGAPSGNLKNRSTNLMQLTRSSVEIQLH